MSTGMNHLSGRRHSQAQFARLAINAARLGELRLGESKLAVLLAQLVAYLLLRFHTVGALDGAEVLQAVNHDEREQDSDRGREDAHLAHANRVSGFHQAGVVETAGEVELGCGYAPAACRL